MTCICCQDKITSIDYKNAEVLRKYVSGTFKIIPSYRNGLCKKHQNAMSQAIKIARFMALLPYTRNQTRRK